MFDVGFTELLLIGIVALVVIGPERLPAVARTAGQWIAKLQRFVRGVKTDLASELESGDLKKLIGDQREQINELKTMVNSAKKDFESSTREVAQGAKKSLGDLENTLKESEQKSTGKSSGVKAGDIIDASTDSSPEDTQLDGLAIDDPENAQQLTSEETPTSSSANGSGDTANAKRTGTESGS